MLIWKRHQTTCTKVSKLRAYSHESGGPSEVEIHCLALEKKAIGHRQPYPRDTGVNAMA